MRFGRRRPDPDEDPAATPTDGEGEEQEFLGDTRARGPFDSSEVEVDVDDPSRVDLGALMVKAAPGLELRLQVDQASETLVSALLVGSEGAVELRAFAAPKDGGLWDEARSQIAAETVRQGGTATEQDGPFGTELLMHRTVETPEGARVQPTRVVGVEGPRWLLRATFLGSAAVSPDDDGPVETALRDTVVVRGVEAMPPGEPLALRMPPGAVRQPD
jgi:hypothetical protein